jgi:hypothetical protein
MEHCCNLADGLTFTSSLSGCTARGGCQAREAITGGGHLHEGTKVRTIFVLHLSCYLKHSTPSRERRLAGPARSRAGARRLISLQA